jgi:hypothetical protein
MQAPRFTWQVTLFRDAAGDIIDIIHNAQQVAFGSSLSLFDPELADIVVDRSVERIE